MNHWDEKYQEEHYIYGKEANAYVKSIFKDTTDLPKKIVLFAEGEDFIKKPLQWEYTVQGTRVLTYN